MSTDDQEGTEWVLGGTASRRSAKDLTREHDAGGKDEEEMAPTENHVSRSYNPSEVPEEHRFSGHLADARPKQSRLPTTRPAIHASSNRGPYRTAMQRNRNAAFHSLIPREQHTSSNLQQAETLIPEVQSILHSQQETLHTLHHEPSFISDLPVSAEPPLGQQNGLVLQQQVVPLMSQGGLCFPAQVMRSYPPESFQLGHPDWYQRGMMCSFAPYDSENANNGAWHSQYYEAPSHQGLMAPSQLQFKQFWPRQPEGFSSMMRNSPSTPYPQQPRSFLYHQNGQQSTSPSTPYSQQPGSFLYHQNEQQSMPYFTVQEFGSQPLERALMGSHTITRDFRPRPDNMAPHPIDLNPRVYGPPESYSGRSLYETAEANFTARHHRRQPRNLLHAVGSAQHPQPDWIHITLNRDQAKAEALELADLEVYAHCEKKVQTIFTDASRWHELPTTDGKSAATAVTTRANEIGTWFDFVFKVYGSKDSGHAEQLAIGKAMELAVKKCQSSGNAPLSQGSRFRLIIFSDAQSELTEIKQSIRRRGAEDSPMGELIRHRRSLQDMGVDVELRWVPGHEGIEGNERADELAWRGRNCPTAMEGKPKGVQIVELRAWRTGDLFWNEEAQRALRKRSKRTKPFDIDSTRAQTTSLQSYGIPGCAWI